MIRDVTSGINSTTRRLQLESYDSRFVRSLEFLWLEINSELLKHGDTYIT